jgi:hypothetical protein
VINAHCEPSQGSLFLGGGRFGTKTRFTVTQTHIDLVGRVTDSGSVIINFLAGHRGTFGDGV